MKQGLERLPVSYMYDSYMLSLFDLATYPKPDPGTVSVVPPLVPPLVGDTPEMVGVRLASYV